VKDLADQGLNLCLIIQKDHGSNSKTKLTGMWHTDSQHVTNATIHISGLIL